MNMEKEARQNKPDVPESLINPVRTDGSMVTVGKKHFLEMLSQLKFKGSVKDGSVTNYLDIRHKLFEGKDIDTICKEIREFSRKGKQRA